MLFTAPETGMTSAREGERQGWQKCTAEIGIFSRRVEMGVRGGSRERWTGSTDGGGRKCTRQS